jgi:chromosome segregation ATPase
MKRVCYTGLTVLMALSLLAGCASMPVFKGSRTKTSASKSSLSTKKEGLYSQVPAANRAPVREAEFDLKEAKAKVELAKEKVKLAELQKQRALLERTCADYRMEFSQINGRKAELEVEVKKVEAIDNSKPGDKAHNIKEIANLKTKKLAVESDGIQVKAEFDTTELRIKKLTKEIEAQKSSENDGSKNGGQGPSKKHGKESPKE